jgi:hypothetical protein
VIKSNIDSERFLKRGATIILLILCFTFNSCSQSFDNNLDSNLPDLIPYRKGELWGYSDKDKNIKIQCTYGYAELFDSFGIAKVYDKAPQFRKSQNVGLINREGDILLPIQKRVDFNYAVIPNENFTNPKYGIYNYVKYKDKLIVLDTNEKNPLNGNIFYKTVESNSYYDKYICYNREGEALLSDSFYYGGHFDNKNFDDICIIGEHRTTKTKSFFSTNGIRVNKLRFDEVVPIDSMFFIGIEKTLKNSIRTSGIYTTSGKVILEGPYEIKISMRDFCRVNDRYFNYKLGEFFGEGYRNSRHDYKLTDSLVVIPEKVGDRKQFSIVRSDLTPFVEGNYISIDIDSRHRKVYITKTNSTQCYFFNGDFVFEHSNRDTFTPIDHDRYLVKTTEGTGIWSVSLSNFVLQPHYKDIISNVNSTYIVKDKLDRSYIADNEGNYTKKNFYNKITYGGKLALRNDTLFYLSENADEVFVSNRIKDYLMYGNVIYYKRYTKKNVTSLDEFYYGYNYKKTKQILDSFSSPFSSSPNRNIKFQNQNYLIVRKNKSLDGKSGKVSSDLSFVNMKGEFILPFSYKDFFVSKNYILAKKRNELEFYSFHSTRGIQLMASASISNNTTLEELQMDQGLVLLREYLSDGTDFLGYINLNGTKYYE